MEAGMENTTRILGIPFFTGGAAEAVSRLSRGGLLVVPAAPALNNLPTQVAYREALLGADLVIPDSGFMVLIWNLTERNRIRKLSGPKYLRVLLQQPNVRARGNTFWIMAGEENAKRNLAWLASRGITVPQSCMYIAPRYGDEIEDRELLERLEQQRPQHVIVTIGGGNQERLGLYLKRNLCYRPAIHCIGAAIAFLSGDQVRIPAWADYLYLGWLFRCFSEPKRYLPRYWSARTLLGLMLKYRSELPPLTPSPR
jgi:exopolysaccharide biosynthesis WecB/TagA/CpsF family protein